MGIGISSGVRLPDRGGKIARKARLAEMTAVVTDNLQSPMSVRRMEPMFAKSPIPTYYLVFENGRYGRSIPGSVLMQEGPGIHNDMPTASTG